MQNSHRARTQQWARFRFTVIGTLLSSPPDRGELDRAIAELARRTWRHPITGDEFVLSVKTIERWYYRARKEQDPVSALEPKVRRDRGTTTLRPELVERIRDLYKEHPNWSYRLHFDNLVALIGENSSLGPTPSYSTVRRFFKANGLVKVTRPRRRWNDAADECSCEFAQREVRSYEVPHVGGLWHLDFHHSSLRVLAPDGQWRKPIVLAILDDHSRLVCHLQWYFSEGVEELVHGLSQAIQKRGLPRALLSDNGAAMLAAEFTQGLERLGVIHEKTLAYSPHQNGKQERFWATLEGRLMRMLDKVHDLSLEFLQSASIGWVEREYHRREHQEISQAPIDRFIASPSVLRQSPSGEELRDAFRLDVVRKQRRSDGTLSLDGKRFEIPSAYDKFADIHVRYARWDLTRIDMIDPGTGRAIARLYPLDRAKNSNARRRTIPPSDPSSSNAEPKGLASIRDHTTLPPLLRKYLRENDAIGRPAAFIPLQPRTVEQITAEDLEEKEEQDNQEKTERAIDKSDEEAC
jgi:putative transposase